MGLINDVAIRTGTSEILGDGRVPVKHIYMQVMGT